MQPIPYLFYTGICEEAFNHYAKVFGTTPTFMRVKGSPMELEMPAEAANAIMHASLPIGEGQIFGSDDIGPDPGAAMAGCNVLITGPDTATSRRYFEALSDGGEIRMPFEPQFWSPGFGAFTDRFGIRWMIDTESADA